MAQDWVQSRAKARKFFLFSVGCFGAYEICLGFGLTKSFELIVFGYIFIWAQIHQALLLQFSLLVKFFTDKLPVKTKIVEFKSW